LDDLPPAASIAISVGIAIVCGSLSYPAVNWWIGHKKKLTKSSSQYDIAAMAGQGQKKKASGRGINLPSLKIDDDDKAKLSDPEKPESASPKNDTPKANIRQRKNSYEETSLTANTSEQDVKLEVKETEPDDVERIFRVYVVVMAAFMSLAHGANDVANSVGPFGAILSAFEGELQKKTEIPVWVFVVAGVFICIGLGTYGYKVMQTIGTKVTTLNGPKAFCANFSATLVILIATRAGIPVSTTHASVGAVMGVGLVGGCGNVNWKVMGQIGGSWIVTLPICGMAMAGVFALLLPCVVGVPFPSDSCNLGGEL